MKKFRYEIVFLALFYILMTIACSGGGSGGGNTGDLSLSLTDASTTEFEGVYVTISEVQVLIPSNVEGEAPNWEAVASPNGTYNLLELVNGMMEPLGLVELEVGTYDQMRLIIGNDPDDGLNMFEEVHPFANYVVVQSAEDSEGFMIHELKIPSGYSTGLKIMKGFQILSGETTDLLLDFHAMNSVIKAGSSGQWLLKPTINVVALNESATIAGTIVDSVTGEPLEGVQVTIQRVAKADGADDADGVVTSTVTEETGEYLVYVEPGVYTVVVTVDGYETRVLEVDTTVETEIVEGIMLAPSEDTGDVEGEIVLEEAGEDLFVTLSFMMVTLVDGVETLVEVESVNVGDGGEYNVSLEDGIYTVVAQFFRGDVLLGEKTYETIVVLNGMDITLNINLANGGDDNRDDVDDDDDPDDVDDDDEGKGEEEKVTVCHNGHEITIAKAALEAHLAHGDIEGPCDGSDDSENGDSEVGDTEDGDSDDDDSEDEGETI